MLILITADIHNGVPDRLKDTIWSMEIMRKYAHSHNIEHVLVLGDLFHDRRNINIEVLNATYEQLKLAKQEGQTWYCFPGNHDMFLKNSWDINSLQPLESVLKVLIDDNTLEIGGQIFRILPFIHYEKDYMTQVNELSKVANDQEILLTHIGVHGATLNECFLLKNWNHVCFDDTPFFRIYTGHFHCHQQVGDKTWYPGSPIPFRFDDGLVEHGFMTFDTVTKEHKFINIFEVCKEYSDYRPADYITSVDTDISKILHLIDGNHIKIIATRDYTIAERNKIKSILKKKNAQRIKFTTCKKKNVEGKQSETLIEHIGSPEQLFRSWLEHDQPKLNSEILYKLHDQIIKSAEERIAVSRDEEHA